MRYSLALLFLIISIKGFSQQCHCKEKAALKNIISCDTIVLKNQSKLYRQYNCDSSWLLFEGKSGKKKVLYSLEKEYIELSHRLGYQFVAEFPKTFLIKNRVVSGCCQPAEYILFDKESGRLVKDFGTILQYSTNLTNNVVVYFNHSTLNAIYVYSIESGKQHTILLPQKRLDYTLKKSGELFPESLVQDVQITDSTVAVNYKYQTKEKKNVWLKAKANINLKKYVR